MVDTLCDSKCQASMSSADLVGVGLAILVNSFKLSDQNFACRPRFLPPSFVPCSTILARLFVASDVAEPR